MTLSGEFQNNVAFPAWIKHPSTPHQPLLFGSKFLYKINTTNNSHSLLFFGTVLVVAIVTRQQAGWPGFRIPAEAWDFLLSKTSIPPLGPTQPPIQWVPTRVLSRRWSGRGVWNWPHLLCRASRWKMSGAKPLLSEQYLP